MQMQILKYVHIKIRKGSKEKSSDHSWCQNSLFNKITLATDICDRGNFHILGVLTHPLFHI